ncbi:Uu.00g012800.m01.CDS01 [Anthostomella pinea]|uniref:Uu.00g012800.m01.CDS01 n=1 Tax=Anthostomella pinea TaxID=933095 RepID=A0AAI8YQB1_9PEZI|nr:Uu.00g012800.m01.CDS01 [Anthostomella pinea]
MSQPDTHHTIVALETFFCPLPDLQLPAPHTCEVREYTRTKPDINEIAERIRDANIVIMTTLPLGAKVLSADVSPHLKVIAVVASGTDSVDLAACRARGIVVANTPHCNATAVAEHAIASYFAARRSIALTHTLTRSGEWPRRGTLLRTLNGPDGNPPRTCRDEVLGIVGYGAVGRKIESTAQALGMKTLIAARKGVAPSYSEGGGGGGRTPFETILAEASVIVLCLPRSPETLNLISDAELAGMRSCAVLVNVSRGGIVDEAALVKALRRGTIAGAAADVYLEEPAGPESSPLLVPDTADLNLVTTPHVAWCAADTNDNYNRALMENLAGWLTTGRPKYPVV